MKNNLTIKPTKEQQKAINLIQTFINTPFKKRTHPFLTISGKGGSGKTTTINWALEPYKGKKMIYGGAISNSATNELAKSLDYGIMKTLTKLLNKKKVINVKTKEYDFLVTENSIMGMLLKKAEILIIDECSMIDDEELNNILLHKKDSCALIFLGDIAQLPPINSTKLTSNTFTDGLLFELKTNMRAKPILDELNNELRDEILFYYDIKQFGKPWLVEGKINFTDVVVKNNNKEVGYYKLETEEEMIDKFIELYQSEPDNPLNVKITAYKNVTIDNLNEEIRYKMFGETEDYFFLGDNVLSGSFYSDGINVINNNQYLVIKAYKEDIDNYDLPVIILTLENEKQEILEGVKCINPKKGYQSYMIRKNQMYKKAMMNKISWENYNNFIDSYAKLSFGYVITSYKVQGQTINNIFVYETEMKSVKPIKSIDKLRSIYVGTSRGKNSIYML